MLGAKGHIHLPSVLRARTRARLHAGWTGAGLGAQHRWTSPICPKPAGTPTYSTIPHPGKAFCDACTGSGFGRVPGDGFRGERCSLHPIQQQDPLLHRPDGLAPPGTAGSPSPSGRSAAGPAPPHAPHLRFGVLLQVIYVFPDGEALRRRPALIHALCVGRESACVGRGTFVTRCLHHTG